MSRPVGDVSLHTAIGADSTDSVEIIGERATFWQAFAWCFLASVCGLGFGFLAVAVQGFFAPWLLFPVMIGLFLAWTLRRLWSGVRTESQVVFWIGAGIAVVFAVIGQHLLHYQEHLRIYQQQELRLRQDPKLRSIDATPLVARPASFWDFLNVEARQGRPVGTWGRLRGVWVWGSWLVDAILLAGTVAILVRQPASRRTSHN